MSQEKYLISKFTKLDELKNSLLFLNQDDRAKIKIEIEEIINDISSVINEKGFRGEDDEVGFRSKPKEYTLEEVKTYDGRLGRKAYVVIDGGVYDVTTHPLWRNGIHFGLVAGYDLTTEYLSCHSDNLKSIENLKKVGQLKA